MEAVLQKDALSETYSDVQNLINKIAWRFYNRYGGDFYEWQAEANLVFIHVYNSYKKNKGAFSTWLYIHVWGGLLDYSKALHKQNPYSPICKEKALESLIAKPLSFSSLEFLDGICEDTKLIINLIWEPPEEIMKVEIKSGKHSCHMRRVLRTYLSKIGWTGRRIQESFEEIERMLND